MRYKLFQIILFSIFLISNASGQGFYHPELDWETIETEHFLVHFHNGAERTAREVAKIAESIYGPVTSMYGHEPDQKVSLIIKDYDDYSNGGAYFYDNKIEIFAPALDYELRGMHPWLWDVVTHEFTHIIQIQTTMKFGRKVPGIYFQWLGYESERRPDVLYGYPNVLVSYPLPGIVIPIWFAEGTAQYSNPALRYDYWDSHRDMILRMYMLEGNPLSWEEMAVFGKKTLGNESSYNAGFSLVAYIGENYGPEKLREISRNLASPFRLTIDGAIKNVLGITGAQLYDEWKSGKIKEYSRMKDSISGLKEGEIIEKEGEGNYYPVFTPDGSKIAYISEKGEDYFRYCRVFLYDKAAKKTIHIVPDIQLSFVRSTLSFSQDQKYLYYARVSRENPHWSAFSDLYRFNYESKKQERLTYGLRAFNPKASEDGKKIVYAFGSDGTLNIGTCDSDGKNTRQLTDYKNGEQTYMPVWSPDGKRIAFGYSIGHNQSIAIIDSNGNNFQLLPHEGDCRDPFFASDSVLYFSWDKGGIFNIYSLNLNSGVESQITNTLGSAFLPTLNKDGDLAYVAYTSTGFKIALAQRDSVENWRKPVDTLIFSKENLPLYRHIAEEQGGINDFLLADIKSDSSASDGNSYQKRKYKSVFTSLSIIPFVRVDNYNETGNALDVIKSGIYIYSSEVLDKADIFGSASINRQFERDIYLNLNYHGRVPLLYDFGIEPTISLDFYNLTRKREVSFELFIDKPEIRSTDVTYNLSEVDLSLTGKLLIESCNWKLGYIYSRYSQDFGSWSHPDFGPIPASKSTYLISNTLTAQLSYSYIRPLIDKDINPIGGSFSVRYFYEMSQFNPSDSAKIQNGFRVPVYTDYNFSRLELRLVQHLQMPVKNHTLSLSLNSAGVLGPTVDEFFDYYAGGLIGMRGYPFYAIGGNKTLSLNAAYQFPLSTNLNFRFLQLYFKKLFASIFFDMGDGWNGSMPSPNKWKKDVGFEFRIQSFSFYAFPTSIFISGAYGLDKFDRRVRDINYRTVSYGNEWRFYLGVLFGFELNDIIPHQIMR